jgi:hypothetical protein
MSYLSLARAVLIGALATIAFGFAASSATATRLSISTTLSTASGVLTLTSSGVTTTCNITLGLGNVSSTTKTAGQTIGTILPSPTSNVSACSGLIRTVTILSGIRLGYTSITGTLPNISAINTTVNSGSASGNPGFLISYNSPISADCLYPAGGITATFNRNTATRLLTTVAVATPGTLTPTALSGACPPAAKLSGTLTVAAPPTVTLI